MVCEDSVLVHVCLRVQLAHDNVPVIVLSLLNSVLVKAAKDHVLDVVKVF